MEIICLVVTQKNIVWSGNVVLLCFLPKCKKMVECVVCWVVNHPCWCFEWSWLMWRGESKEMSRNRFHQPLNDPNKTKRSALQLVQNKERIARSYSWGVTQGCFRLFVSLRIHQLQDSRHRRNRYEMISFTTALFCSFSTKALFCLTEGTSLLVPFLLLLFEGR